MSFDLEKLRALVGDHARVARVVVAETRGSVPREVGAAMYVFDQGIAGTIGGGALEFEAIETAKTALANGADRLETKPLGPALGQCCGGAVTLLTEVWDRPRLDGFTGSIVARSMPGKSDDMPLGVSRVLAAARGQGETPQAQVISGWMVEPLSAPKREIWIWGAGHVGRALVATLAPLPDVAIRWADSRANEFPATLPANVETLIAENPADLVSLAPAHAEHLVLTFSHALDLEICHRVLSRPFRMLGLIGSETKRARFKSRLIALGHTPEQIARIDCPIGDPSLGKHPHAIALGVATEILKRQEKGTARMERTA